MKIKKTANESGIAIIIVLGFMAVLLLLIISFINLSIVNKKISHNYNALQSARMAAQTGYNRALAILNYAKNSTLVDMSKIYSSYEEINGETVADSDGLPELLETIVNGSTYTPNYTSDTGPCWQYLIIKDNESDTQIVGRLAYVVILEAGKIDPSAVVDSGINIADKAVTEDTALALYSSYGIIGRPGRNVNELFLKSVDWLSSDHLQKMSTTNAEPVGLLPKGERWGGFIDLFDLII